MKRGFRFYEVMALSCFASMVPGTLMIALLVHNVGVYFALLGLFTPFIFVLNYYSSQSRGKAGWIDRLYRWMSASTTPESTIQADEEHLYLGNESFGMPEYTTDAIHGLSIDTEELVESIKSMRAPDVDDRAVWREMSVKLTRLIRLVEGKGAGREGEPSEIQENSKSEDSNDRF